MDESSLPGVGAEEIERARAPLERAWTLPPAAYVRPDIYDLEVERILRRSWAPLARTDQAPEPGDYIAMDFMGQPVLLVHGLDGRFRAMANVCRHRAAPVAEGAGRRKLFTCPYHAWSYDTEGRLIAAPLMDGVEGFAPEDCRLGQIRTEVWEGFVMVNLDPDAAPFAPQVEPLRRYFQAFRMGEMAVVRTLTYDSGWNWKVLVENFMEAYHHLAAHAQTLEPAFHARDSVVPDNDGPWSILHMPAAGPDASRERLVQGLEDWQAQSLFAAVAFPHFLFALHGDGMAWYQVLPQTAGRFTLNIHICAPRYLLELEGADEIIAALEQATAAIHAEDIAVNDLVWRGLNAPMTGQGRLSTLERSIWQMNQWWLTQMGL
jgi:phenylpropionate dioxygenase-like ring-hydroxylating dioxygenase large terminal subunit